MSTTKNTHNALKISEAYKLAEEIRDLADSFIQDVDAGRSDAASRTIGWNDTDSFGPHDFDDGVHDLLCTWRTWCNFNRRAKQ